MYTNKFTKSRERLSHAKLCIEVGAAEPLPDVVTIVTEDGEAYTQTVVYDWKSARCPTCCCFSNGELQCLEKPKTIKPAQVWRVKTKNTEMTMEGDGPKAREANIDGANKQANVHTAGNLVMKETRNEPGNRFKVLTSLPEKEENEVGELSEKEQMNHAVENNESNDMQEEGILEAEREREASILNKSPSSMLKSVLQLQQCNTKLRQC